MRLGLQALALLGVVGGTAAFAGLDHSVELVVDGRARTVHAFGGTVADVLASEDVSVGGHDIVSPAPGSRVTDDSTVVVRYGRPLTVTTDGDATRYWTTARSVDEAIAQLDLRADRARLSVSRSMPLGRQGLALDVDTLKQVDLSVGGERTEQTTYATTVGELLDQLQLTVDDDDRLSTPRSTKLTEATKIVLTRVEHRRSSKTKKVAFTTTSSKSAKLDKGTTKVVTKGRAGTAKVTYDDTYTNGKRTDREVVATVVVRRARAQVEQVGTREVKTAIPSGGGGGLNWAALARCESGGNPRAVNPAGYYGLYQFSLSTWAGVGGSGNPVNASASEQTARAQALYKRGGAGQWGCGSHLFD
ncbi:ubiquitin-like domain-containing protein [Angustibacter aerolatus]